MTLEDWHDSSHGQGHGARAQRGSEPSNQLVGRSEPQGGELGVQRPDPNQRCLLLGGAALLGRATAEDTSLEQGQPPGAWSEAWSTVCSAQPHSSVYASPVAALALGRQR